VTTDDKPDTPDTPDPEVVEDETTAVELTDAELTDADDTPAEDIDAAEAEPEATPKRRFSVAGAVAFGVLPILALLLAAAAGYLRWEDSSRRDADAARISSVQAAKDSTAALLSYKPDTVEKDLGAARDRLTGSFLDAYTQLVNTVVIPGAKEKKISAVAAVPAAASVSAKPDHAVVLLFVDQTVVVGTDAPTNTASSVRVTLEKIHDRWLISGFDPI
jgi:Mce-associated membrane protein